MTLATPNVWHRGGSGADETLVVLTTDLLVLQRKPLLGAPLTSIARALLDMLSDEKSVALSEVSPARIIISSFTSQFYLKLKTVVVDYSNEDKVPSWLLASQDDE
ncbi:hypothetical protein AXG93_2035s1840 [Marchantia polymorpha subsp. ruderalis]|uniref:Uncharacterized protein n=1 Tax=Marchantia polymorpha subsp. ruderalis TaxID=1480154 RepID=A0A176VPG5_MARPO|nr:hypothetical protein AXG93_2035s1840 [Marchantia polymorpha subsp. ruderalis]